MVDVIKKDYIFSLFLYNKQKKPYNSNMKKKIRNLFYIFFPLLLGGIVGFIIKDSIDYTELVRPPLSPPKIIFPIMWSILYLLMGIAYYSFKKNTEDNKVEGVLYYIQLFINLLWSIIFFVLKWRFIAIIWILILLIMIINLAGLFKQRNRLSYYLFIPYILWVMFATYLNIGIYILN